jgi:serine/threonine protein phosphatase PrpC
VNPRPGIVLWGHEHVERRRRHVEAVSHLAAAGISAGYHPNVNRHTDPNEDAVAIVTGPGATLLGLADGHNGFASTREALGRVLARFDQIPAPGTVSDDNLVDFWEETSRLVRAAAHASGQTESRTTLILAIAGNGLVQWAAMGDSLLAIVAPDRDVTVLGDRRSHYVGYPMTRGEVDERLWRGTENTADGGWLILATDGLSDFVDDEPATLRAATTDATDARSVVERLIDAAIEAGAGDNIAVAALRLG